MLTIQANPFSIKTALMDLNKQVNPGVELACTSILSEFEKSPDKRTLSSQLRLFKVNISINDFGMLYTKLKLLTLNKVNIFSDKKGKCKIITGPDIKKSKLIF